MEDVDKESGETQFNEKDHDLGFDASLGFNVYGKYLLVSEMKKEN